MFISQQILQRWRCLCVHTLKIKVLHRVFSSGRNHQRHSWTPPPRSWKLSAAWSWGTEEMKQFRRRNQEPREEEWTGLLHHGLPCYYRHPPAWWRDETAPDKVAPPPPSHQAPNVWITPSCFLLMNGEETQLKNKAERCDADSSAGCRSQRCQTDHTAVVKHPNGH